MTDADSSHILTQVEAEQMLARTLRKMDELTHAHADICDEAAQAESDYRRAKGVKVLAILRTSEQEKWSAIKRDARIELELSEERHRHLVAQARVESSREALRTIRTRVEALRTISASIRGNV